MEAAAKWESEAVRLPKASDDSSTRDLPDYAAGAPTGQYGDAETGCAPGGRDGRLPKLWPHHSCHLLYAEKRGVRGTGARHQETRMRHVRVQGLSWEDSWGC